MPKPTLQQTHLPDELTGPMPLRTGAGVPRGVLQTQTRMLFRWVPSSRAQLLAGALAAICQPAGAASCGQVVSPMAFGLYSTVQAGATDTTATVTISCVPGVGDPLTTPYTLTVAGTGSGNDSIRSITSGAARLYYQVYSDASRSLVWGNGGSSGAGVSSSVTSASVAVAAMRVHTAYARMPAGQNVPPGTYAGSLLITIDY